MPERPAIVPCVFYKDPIAALKWLEAAFRLRADAVLLTGRRRASSPTPR